MAKVGDRIELINTSREESPVKPGDTGTVWRVTQRGIVRVKWDDGTRFDLDPQKDRWKVLSNEQK